MMDKGNNCSASREVAQRNHAAEALQQSMKQGGADLGSSLDPTITYQSSFLLSRYPDFTIPSTLRAMGHGIGTAASCE
jgi:hypothetical protein